MTKIEIAQAQLRAIASELEAIRFRLLGVQASLPHSPEEQNLLQEDDAMDIPTEIWGFIDCLLMDRIDPALRDLQAAAAAGRPERESR
jgi:hypothetical protein